MIRLFPSSVRFTVSHGKMFDDGCVAFEDGNGTLEAGFIRAIQHSNSLNIDSDLYGKVHHPKMSFSKHRCHQSIFTTEYHLF